MLLLNPKTLPLSSREAAADKANAVKQNRGRFLQILKARGLDPDKDQ